MSIHGDLTGCLWHVAKPDLRVVQCGENGRGRAVEHGLALAPRGGVDPGGEQNAIKVQVVSFNALLNRRCGGRGGWRNGWSLTTNAVKPRLVTTVWRRESFNANVKPHFAAGLGVVHATDGVKLTPDVVKRLAEIFCIGLAFQLRQRGQALAVLLVHQRLDWRVAWRQVWRHGRWRRWRW